MQLPLEMYTIGTLKKEKCTFVLAVTFRAPYLKLNENHHFDKFHKKKFELSPYKFQTRHGRESRDHMEKENTMISFID